MVSVQNAENTLKSNKCMETISPHGARAERLFSKTVKCYVLIVTVEKATYSCYNTHHDPVPYLIIRSHIQ